jgi:hypothetical protein
MNNALLSAHFPIADHPLDSRLSFPEARFGKVRAKPTVASQ